MTDLRTAAQQALEQVQEFKRRWWLVPAFGNKVNKATREAITNAHSPIFELEHALRAALAEPNRAQKLTEAGYTRRPTLREMSEPTTEDSSEVEPVQEILTQEEINNLTDVHLTADIDTPVGEDEPVAWVEGAEEFARAVESAVLRKMGRPAEPVREPVLTVDALRVEFERRYRGKLGITRVEGGVYLSPAIETEWQQFVRKYTSPPQRKPLTEEEVEQCFRDAGITIKGHRWTNAVRNVEAAHGIKEGT